MDEFTDDWKPGDLAMARPEGGGEEFLVVRCQRGGDRDYWLASSGWPTYFPSTVSYAYRPVVKIDPENREDVGRLNDLLGKALEEQVRVVDCLQQALREYANPTPPKPPEPTGLGAVVEDAEGRRWVRGSETSTVKHWRCSGDSGMGKRAYHNINAVRVLSEGWSE